MLPSDIRSTKSIAAVRIHVERAIVGLKQYRLSGGRKENSLFDILDRVVLFFFLFFYFFIFYFLFCCFALQL